MEHFAMSVFRIAIAGVAVMQHKTPVAEKIPLILNLPLFAEIPPAICRTIVSVAQSKQFWQGQSIFSQDDPVQQATLLLSGCVKVTQLSPGGNEVILRLCGMGDLIGSFDLSADCRHSSTAQAIQPSTVLLWPVARFEERLERFPTFRRNVIRVVEGRLNELEQRFREVSTEGVAPRLSSELIRLSERFGRAVNGYKEINLSQKELAQLTGTTLYTVSRLLGEWEKCGIVTVSKRVVQVRDAVALRQRARG
jgi:CRP/FNR family transcriptional regulator, nitrogen oxide reductase regulator